MKAKGLAFNTAIFLLAAAAVSYLFYDSIYAFLIFLPFTKLYITRQKRKFYIDRIQKLESQFCEMIGSLSTALSAGLSPENSFISARKDMVKMYGEKSYIVYEMDEVINGLKINVPLVDGLKTFAIKAKSEDIRDFVTVFSEAVKSGGNLVLIIKNTVTVMREKRHIEEEIAAMLKGKMLEQKVICVIPFFIFVYLKFSSKEFISVLYHNITGEIVMTVCLLLYIGSILLSEKIVNIRV